MNNDNPHISSSVAPLLAWMRDYANKRINSSLLDARRSIPPHIVLDFGNKGLLGLQSPTDYGGLNLSNRDSMAVLIQLGAIDLNLAALVAIHNYLGIRPIMNFSNAAVREELLPKLASGREISAFALTEPSAGSNPTAIEGSAVLMPDGRVKLNGTKMWIGNASWAGVINVFLRYYDAEGKPNGICGYVIRQGQPGLKMGPELMTMGMRGMVQNTFTMKDLMIEPINQLGQLGRGLIVAQDAMMQTRLALGAVCLGAMKRCLQLMLRYADRRLNISTGRLLDNSVSIIRLSTLSAEAHVLEKLVHFISQHVDQNQDIPEDFLIVAKVSGSEFLWRTVDDASQMLGGRGYLENNEISKIMRDARVARIFEGPTETMTYYMGSRLIVNGKVLTNFLQEHVNAADIANQLIEARDVVVNRCKQLGSVFAGTRKFHVANYQVGEMVTWAIFYAVARHVEDTAIAEDSRARRWAKLKFETLVESAKHGSLGEAIAIETNALKNLIGGFEEQIGDMEQTLPGEEWGLDPYLRINQ